MELENQKTSSRELFLPENDFQNSSIVNFPKQHPEFEGLEINQRHEIQDKKKTRHDFFAHVV